MLLFIITGGFTLKSRKGPCAFDQDAVLVCGLDVDNPAVFTVRNKSSQPYHLLFFQLYLILTT